MKAALILTGHMRCWKYVWPHIKSQYVDVYNPDIFVSTWSDEGWWRPSSDKGYNEQSPLLDVEQFCQLYNPKSIDVENYSDVEKKLSEIASRYKNFIHNPKNVVSMFYKISRGFDLLEQYAEQTNTKYDLVIRTRPDLVFNHKLSIIDPNILFTTHHPNYYKQGTGDTFQASSYQNIKQFCETFYNLDNLYDISNTLCPHVITKTAIDVIGCPHAEISSNFKIVHSPYGQFFDTDETTKSVVIDVGSNDCGDSRKFLTKNNIEVHCFEPVTEIFNWASIHVTDPRIIKNNLAVDVEEKLTTVNIAAWEKWFCNSLHQFTDNVNQIWKGPYHHGAPNFHFTNRQNVYSTRLDTYCKSRSINKIDYLWVSACGNDFNVLKSLGSYIDVVKQGRVTASAETKLYKNVNNDVNDIAQWLLQHNFKVHIEYDDYKYKNEAEVFFER